MRLTPSQFEKARNLSLVLSKLFPKLFSNDIKKIKPLKIHIRQDIAERVKNNPKLEPWFKKYGYQAIRLYVNRLSYCNAVLHQKYRYDLDGNIVGKVTAQEREYAKKNYAKLKAFRDEKRASTISNTNKKRKDITSNKEYVKQDETSASSLKNRVTTANKPIVVLVRKKLVLNKPVKPSEVANSLKVKNYKK